MIKSYKTIKGESSITYEISKSKFIGHCKHVKSVEDAKDYIESIRKRYSDATHNCYAYVLDETSNTQKFSDDGEPQGTAGMPILDVLTKQGLTFVVVVVTRYYGGIKLGAGGLVRAYSKTAAMAIDVAEKAESALCSFYCIYLDYDVYNRLQKNFSDMEILSTTFNSQVEIEFVTMDGQITQKLTDICGGRCRISYQKDDYYDFKI